MSRNFAVLRKAAAMRQATAKQAVEKPEADAVNGTDGALDRSFDARWVDSLEQNISGDDLLASLKRRMGLAAFIFSLPIVVALAYLHLAPSEYESRLKLLVKNERADVVVSADRNGGSVFRGEVDEAQINSEIELLNSNTLLEQVALETTFDNQAGPGQSKVDLPQPAESALDREMNLLRAHLNISPVRRSNIIEVSYRANDPKRAVKVLNHLSRLYLNLHLKVHSSPGTYQFFLDQANRYRIDLSEAEGRLAAFRKSNSVVILLEQKTLMLQKASEAHFALREVEAAVSSYRGRISELRKQLETTEARIVTQSMTMPNQYSVERLHTMLAELQNRRTLLASKYRLDDRAVLEVDQELADTHKALDAAMKLKGLQEATDVNPVRQTIQTELARQEAELTGAEGRRKTLLLTEQTYQRDLNKLGDATSDYEDFSRLQKTAEDNYLLYSKKTEEARIAELLDQQKISNVAIAEAPIEPRLPIRRSTPRFLGAAILLGLIGGTGIPLLLGRLRMAHVSAARLNAHEFDGLEVPARS